MTWGWAVVLVPAVALLGVIAGVVVRGVHPPPPPARGVDRFGYPVPQRPSTQWPQTVHVWHHLVVEHHVTTEEVPAPVRGWIEGEVVHRRELPAARAREVER